MTALREVAGLDIVVNNKVSEGAAAAARDLEKVEAAADRTAAALKEVETGTRLAGDTFDKTAARSDVLARAEQRRADIMARAERETAALTAAAEREGRSADELAAAIAAVTLRRDADIAKAQRQAEVQRAQQLALVGGASAQTQALAAGTGAIDKYVASNDNGARGVSRFSQAIGQAGFQLQDFVVQVGSGQNALVALGQQGSQMLGVFGTGGAIAGAVLAIGAMTANFLLGKSAAEQLTEALGAHESHFKTSIELADRMEAALRRQNSQYLSAAEAGNRYRSGLQGMGEELVRLARYYERLTDVQRENERVTLAAQQRALTAGGGTLQQDILRPVQGRIATADGGLNFDMSGMMGQLNSFSTSLENVPQELRGVTQAAIEFRDSGRITVEGFQQLINAVAVARAGSADYRTELEALEQRYIAMLPRVREYEETMRRLGISQTAINPANAAQVALEGLRGVTGEVGGNYQTRQRILEQRRRIQEGLSSGLATDEDRLAGRSSLRALAQQEQGLTPATQQQLRALDEQARLSMVAEGAARELAQAEMDLDRAARASGAGMASASEKAQARALVQERLDRQLSQTGTNLDRQITGETAIASAYGRSVAEGREMEAAVRASADALKFAAEGTDRYTAAVETLTVKYLALTAAQAERQLMQRNSQSRDELAYLQREAELIGANADQRERELAALRARQAAGAAAGSEAAKEAERLAVQLVDARRNTEQLRNSWNELTTIGERAFDRIGSAITEAFTNGSGKAINFGNIAKAVLSEVAQAALKLAVINPALNAAFGGTRGTLGGIAQVAGLGSLGLGSNSQVVLSADGSWSAAGNRASQAAGLSGLGRISGLSGITGYGGLSNTGWTGVDSFLNQGISSSSYVTANIGSQTYNGLPVADTIGMNGATYGNAIAGAAGMGLGAYSIYSGIQRGGVGGTVSALGGAAGMVGGASSMGLLGSTGWLAGLGPYGMIAAAVLAIVGALLPGQKPSGKGQEFRVDLLSGETEKNGLRGSRYSAENASQAEAAARGIASLSSQLSSALGNARIPGEAAVGVTSSRGDGPGALYLEVSGRKAQFANSEEGAKELADKASVFLLEAFRDAVSGDYKGILAASGTVEDLQSNLTRYETEYKAFGKSAEAASAFQQQLDQVTASFQDAVDWAQRMSLSTDVITEARQKEIDKLTAARDLNLKAYGIGLDIRLANATGVGGLDPQLAAFDIQAEQQMAAARQQLEDWSTDAVRTSEMLAKNEAALAAERLKIQEDYAAEATAITKQQMTQATQSAAALVTNLADYARGLAFGDKSALSVQDQFGLALRQYNGVSGAALAGDFNSMSKLPDYSDALLGAGRAMYGSGAEYAALFGRVADTLEQVSTVAPDTLTASAMAQIAMESQQAGSATVVAAIQSLQARVEELTSIVNQQGLKPTRAA